MTLYLSQMLVERLGAYHYSGAKVFFNNGYSNSPRASTIKPFTGVINIAAYKTTVITIPSDSLPQSDACGKARSLPL